MDNDAPTRILGQTLVNDVKRDKQVLWIEGVLVLPVGSVIELGDPLRSAKVVRVRLLAPALPQNTVRVCLDVEVPE